MVRILDQSPWWLTHLLWSVLTVAAAYLAGGLVSSVIISRLVRLASRSRGSWDDIVVGELRRRISFWALLVGFWLALGHWPLSPRSAEFTSGVLFVLGALSVTLSVSAIAGRLVATYGPRRTPTIPVAGLAQNIVRLLITILGALVILNGLGISITPMLTAAGIGGLAVALALQEPLSNLFAGVFLSLAGQVRIGDYVRLDSGMEGRIVDMNWRSTRLEMLASNIVVVPNAKLAQAVVTNYSMPSEDLSVQVEVSVAGTSDLAAVERITCEVGRAVMSEVAGGVPEFEPLVRFHTFGASTVKFTAILRGRAFADQYLVTHEFVKRLHARFGREGMLAS